MPQNPSRPRRAKSPAPEEAKNRLLDAALDLFSQHGLNRVSTRMLADQAKVNLFAIQYHFGGKEGLYLAAVRHAIRKLGGEALSEVKKIEEAMREEELSKESCRSSFCRLLEIMLKNSLSSKKAHSAGRLVLRQLLEGGEGFDLLFRDLIEPFTECCYKLVGRILDLDKEDPKTKLCVHSITGQVFSFDVCRSAIVRSLNWQGYDRDELELIRQTVIGNAQTILGAQEKAGFGNCRAGE